MAATRPHGTRGPRLTGADRAAPVASAAGAALAVLTRAVGLLRRRERPLHPRGTVHDALLVLEDTGAPGARTLGAPLTASARVRLSRSVGLPAGAPDIDGVAVRWTAGGRVQDLLLAGTGTGAVSRFVLVPRRRPLSGPLGTLMPLATPDGAVVVTALPAAAADDAAGPGSLVLALRTARGAGPWQPCGRLVVLRHPDDHDDPALRLDPVLHPPGSTRVPRWAARLRAAAYRTARRDGTGAGPGAGAGGTAGA